MLQEKKRYSASALLTSLEEKLWLLPPQIVHTPEHPEFPPRLFMKTKLFEFLFQTGEHVVVQAVKDSA